MDPKLRSKVLIPFVIFTIFCIYNSYRGIVLKHVSANFVRGSIGKVHTGKEAETTGLKWLAAGIVTAGIAWRLNIYLDEND